MGQDYSSAGPDDGQFDKTRWSMVLGAVQSRAPCAQKALAELCGLYWRPLYAFARRRGRSPEDAQDLVQGFFEHLIGSRGLATVERSKGRFRSFLLASFQNFITAENRRARAEKRGGRAEVIRLDWQDAETRLVFEPEDRLTPETLYDAQWALLLLRRATERLEQEQAVAGKAKNLSHLERLFGPRGRIATLRLPTSKPRTPLASACRTSRASFTGYASGTRSWCARKSSAPCWTRQR